MGKKKPEEMAKQKSIFVEGALKQGHDEQKAGELFDLLAFFAGYGFNKSHSAAYGVISYHTAWLKAHHRAEYMSALMSIDSGNSDKVLLYIGDCRRAGIKVLPPDVNHSQAGFDVPKGDRRTIRFGMLAVKGVGEGACQAILEARERAGGRFKGFLECLEDLDFKRVNKKVLESLVCCGAFDWTGLPRQAMFEGLPGAMSLAQGNQEQAAAGQVSLFGGIAAPRRRLQLPDLGEWPMALKLAREREALGFFITGHPLEAYKGLAESLTTCSIPELDRLSPDREVSVAGMVTALRQVQTKKGDKMAFITIEDQRGSIECVLFPKTYAQNARALATEEPILLRGTLERSGEGSKILADSVEVLSEVRIRRTREVRLSLDLEDELGEDRAMALRKLVAESPGRCPLRLELHLRSEDARVRVLVEGQVVPDEAFMQGVETLFRRPDVVELRW